MSVLASLAAVVAAYLIGSLSFAVIVSRAMGLADPRTYGSGNPGATNVLRTGNNAAAMVTLALDALKGYLPVVLAFIGAEHQQWWGEGTVAAVGLTAFLGHLWPLFFHFKGGKGVATAAGVLFGFNPLLGLATLATTPAVMTAQVQFDGVPDVGAAARAVLAQRRSLLATGDASIPRMVERGGRWRELELRVLDAAEGVVVVHVYVDVGDAMGANMVDTVAEALADPLHALVGGTVGLRILSNLCARRMVTVRARVSSEMLGGDAVADGIARASRFAAPSTLSARPRTTRGS